MKVRNNYDECLTNVACSIRKYFELDYHHKTIKEIDDLLQEKQPKNVVLLVFDGLGSTILDKTLDEKSFFRRNRIKDITSVFPATTTAATNSLKTGLNPSEHCWLGWNTYIEKIKQTITLFLSSEKGKNEKSSEFISIFAEYEPDFITSLINEAGRYEGIEISDFGDIAYKDIDEMVSIIQAQCEYGPRKYMYVYDLQPDSIMHKYGPYSQQAKKEIMLRNEKIEKMCEELTDTVVIIVADHGHIAVDNIYLRDYPDIYSLLERTTSIEQRAVSFKIKEGRHSLFVERFNHHFSEYFSLYSKEEIIEAEIFGPGKIHENFQYAIGDFIAIAEKGNKCLLTEGDFPMFSHHAGYTDEEIYVPLIIIDRV
ncbi:MAG TPA: alkaline phosphatase family protein [Erysipelotrichaceae bacterium]|nr:alkaline phosphatase family protein [Erysipelotrichaceae bacterium]HQB32192.1 alkaline phosphatase family protein [Erysipelotrichaceae bacterium]